MRPGYPTAGSGMRTLARGTALGGIKSSRS